MSLKGLLDAMTSTACVAAGRSCAGKPSLSGRRQHRNQLQHDSVEFVLHMLQHVPESASATLRFASRTVLTCSACTASREVVDQATSVGDLVCAVPVPARRGVRHTLEACLAAALAADAVPEARCATCVALGTITHGTKLNKAGRLALFSLKRFTNASRKRTAHVGRHRAQRCAASGARRRATCG